MRDYRPGPEKKMEALNVRNWPSKMDDWQTGSSLTQQGRLFKSSAAQGTPPLHGAEHIRWLYITPATHCIHIPFICPSIMEKGKQSKECEPKTRAMLSWIAGKKELRHTTKSLLNRSRLLCRKCFKCRQKQTWRQVDSGRSSTSSSFWEKVSRWRLFVWQCQGVALISFMPTINLP